MESHARSSTKIYPKASSSRSTPYPVHPNFAFGDDFERGSGYSRPPSPPKMYRYRSKSISARRPQYSYDSKVKDDFYFERSDENDLYESMNKLKLSEKKGAREKMAEENLRRRERRYPSYNENIVIVPAGSRRPRRYSDTAKPPPQSPLLVVPDSGPRYRPASYHGSSDRYD